MHGMRCPAMNEKTETTKAGHGHGEELMELHHEPVPGYKKILFIAFTVMSAYLAVIMLFSTH
jgi:hypothetical protein